MIPQAIFAHTHWDREWFERADATKPLLILLFENLFRMVEEDPKYYFILDGQTVMIQDYLSLLSWSEKKEAVRKLKELTKNLSWGPFYGQIDWRIGEESAIEALE
ncbi:MAG TPA: alpha-mannosidase, partial [Thermotogota bacterium]|nr:alpha-mannosidase [Thermotogota bacterium]